MDRARRFFFAFLLIQRGRKLSLFFLQFSDIDIFIYLEIKFNSIEFYEKIYLFLFPFDKSLWLFYRLFFHVQFEKFRVSEKFFPRRFKNSLKRLVEFNVSLNRLVCRGCEPRCAPQRVPWAQTPFSPRLKVRACACISDYMHAARARQVRAALSCSYAPCTPVVSKLSVPKFNPSSSSL